MAGPEGLHACSISILVTMRYPHDVDMLSTTRSNLWSKYFPNLGEVRMMNVMLRPPTGSGSNLCDKCDGVQSQDDNLEHPSSWMSYPGASLVSGMESLKGGATLGSDHQHRLRCHHRVITRGWKLMIWTDDWSVNDDDDVIVMLSGELL